MEEDGDLLNVDLENVRLSNILNNQNGPGNVLLKMPELSEARNELLINQNNNDKKNLLKNKKKLNIDELCNNLTFCSIICFIQSLISLGLFYLYYIYKFTFEDKTDFILVEVSLFIILLILLTIIAFIGANKEEIEEFLEGGNYTLFFLTLKT